MAGTDFVFNAAKGRFVHYATLPAASDALVAVLLEASGLEADATLKDYDTLAALLAGTSNEQTTMGRKTLANVAVTVDDTGDDASFDCDDLTYTAASGNAVGKLVVCYDPDTGTGDDTTLIPLTAHSLDVTPDGNDVEVQIHADGVAVASEPA